MPDEETLELGGNIELTGFRELDGGSMIILKKIVGNYAKKFSELAKNFEKLHLTMKAIHEREKSEKYELHAKVIDNGKLYNAEAVDRNLFVAVDSILKKIEKEMS